MATFDIELRDSGAVFNINMGVNAWVMVNGEWKKITDADIIVNGEWKKHNATNVIVDGIWKDV